jgi:uncharacterized membrane protein YecN with MAPEG domain
MQSYSFTAAVTLLALLLYFWMGLQVAGARRQCGITPPACTGDPVLERTIRAHVNTLEWLPIFLPSLWLFALYWDDRVAAGLGLVWLAGRFVYFRGYVAEVGKRAPGFFIQFLACAALLLGALGRIVYLGAAS